MTVRKETDKYVIEPSFSDIESYNAGGGVVELSQSGDSAGTKGTEVTIVLPEEFILAIQRQLGSTFAENSLDLSFGKASVFNRNMCNFPLPISKFYSSTFPELNEELYQENIAIAKEIDSNVEVTNSFLVHIGVASRLIFQLDSKNIKVRLVSMTENITIEEDHPFCVTGEFTIENDSEESNSSSAEAEILQVSPYGKVVIVEQKIECGFFDTAFALFQERKEYANCIQTANYYIKVMNEQFWLTEDVVAIEKKENELLVSIIAGIEANGRAFTRIPLANCGLKIRKNKVGLGVLSIEGQVTMQHAIGEVLYPARTILASKRSHFDIISDSESWTLNGPMIAEYNQGQSDLKRPTVMFSWENRETLEAKVSTMTASRLSEEE